MTTASQQPVDAVAFAEQIAALDARETAITAREAALAKERRDAAHADHVAFAEALVTGARLAPAGRDRVVGLLDHLDATQPIAFDEGDANRMTPAAAFRSLLDGAQPVIALGEHAGADRPAPDAEADPALIARRAVAFAEKSRAAGTAMTIQQAVRIVTDDPAA